MRKPFQTIDKLIFDRVIRPAGSTTFSTRDFADLGAKPAVRKALERLARQGKLRRVRRGYYDRPTSHPLLGQTPPDPMDLVRSMMKNSSAKWQVTGAYAANLLHLSEQVPAKMVILTDGAPRKVKIDRLVIEFRRASPRNLLGAGRPAGLAIQALRSLRPAGITPDTIAKLRRELRDPDKAELARLRARLPAWLQPYVQQITP